LHVWTARAFCVRTARPAGTDAELQSGRLGLLPRECAVHVIMRTGGCGRSHLASTNTRHHGVMQSRARRDEKTVQIFTALLMFVGVLLGGGILLVLAHLLLGMGEDIGSALVTVLACAAGAVSVAYLVRRRSR